MPLPLTSAIQKIPVSDKGLEVFRNYSTSMFMSVESEFYKNTMMKNIPDGYWLAVMNLVQTPLPDGTMFGSISAACLDDEGLKAIPYFATSPLEVFSCTGSANFKYLHARYGIAQRNVTQLVGPYIPAPLDLMNYIKDEWKMLVDDIRNGTIGAEITMPAELRSCQAIMSAELAHASTSYAHYVAGGNMGEPKLIFLQRETFQFHREMKMYEMGINENQLKPVRVLDKPELIQFFTLLEER